MAYVDTRGSTSSGWRLGAGVGPVARGDNPQTAQIVVDFYIHKIDYYQRNRKPISYAPDSVSAVVTAISSSWIWVWRRKLTLHQDWRSTTRKLEREGDRTKICSKCAWSNISSGAILYLLLQFIHLENLIVMSLTLKSLSKHLNPEEVIIIDYHQELSNTIKFIVERKIV